VNNPLDFEINDENALDFALQLSLPFSVSVSLSLDFPCRAHAFFPERQLHHCRDLCRNFTEICTKCDAVPLEDPSRNQVTRLRIKGRKKSAHPPSCVKLCTLTSKICCYYHLPLRHATAAAAQMAAPVPEIMNTAS
jgi:hypothetical protein